MIVQEVRLPCLADFTSFNIASVYTNSHLLLDVYIIRYGM